MTTTWNWIAALLRRLSFRAHRASLDDELHEEMQFHLDMLARDNETRGMSPEEAHEAARRQFGSATMLREASRDHWSLGWLDAIWQDIRYSIRSLVRTPGVTLTALLTLTLGIGATVTVVALLDATLLHPIALRDVDRLVTIVQAGLGESTSDQISTGDYISVRNGPTVLQGVALSQYWTVTVSGRTAATSAEGDLVTPNYFSVLGVTPFLGRSFTTTDADASRSSATVVILSYAFWLQHFNADPAVIGRSVVLNGIPRTIVGVLRRDDGFPTNTAVWGPLALPANAALSRSSFNGSSAIARLRAGATAADAARDVAAIQRRLVRESPAANAGWRLIAAPLKEYRTADVKPAILLVVVAVIGVLLIACTNVANLLLVRATAREREIAVRAALGAGRAQVARQLVIEGLLLSLTGGVLGVILGELGVTTLKRNVPVDLASFLPGWEAMSVNRHVLIMVFAVCIVIGVAFSAFPALRAARTDLTGALKQGARGSTGTRRIARVRTALVVSELALAVILLAGAGLLVQSFTRLTAASTGLQPDHVLTLHLQLPATLDASHAAAYHRTVLRRLEVLPGVRRAALVDRLPLSNSNNSSNFVPDSRPTLQILRAPNAHEEVVTSGYFAAMGIPTISGRNFNEADRDTTASVVIVNRTLANRYWSNGDAIGHTIRMSDEGPAHTIVGVVGDVWYAGADEAPGPEVYFPMQGRLWNTDVVVQTIEDPAAMTRAIVKAIGPIDPSVAVTQVMTMRAMMARHYSFNHILADGLAIFALIALGIAAAGIYGVVSFGVAQRTQEIGVRMALGAKYHTVMRMVLMEGVRVAAISVVLGLIGAWFAGNALAFLLYGVAPRDPVTLTAVAIILSAVAIAASYFPARRAGRVEPVVALRYE